MNDDLVIDGNLHVHGTTITANSINIVIQDQFMALSNGGTKNMDVGIFYNRGTEGNAAVWYDASDTRFKLSETRDPFSNTTISQTSAANLTVGAFTTSELTIGAVAIAATGTELNYVDGVTSSIQTQLDTKIATTASASNDFVTFTRLNANLNTTTANVTAVEARRVANIAGAVSTVTTGNLTGSRALASDGFGKIAASDVTSTELGYLDGVTSAIQTQLDTKIATTASASNDFVTFTRLNANLNTTTANVAAVEARRAANNTLLTAEDTALQARIAANTLVAASNDFVTFTRLNANLNTTTANVTAVETRRTQNIAGAVSTVTTGNLTASRALASDGFGKIAVSDITSTELGYLDGVSSAIQTQLNTKIATTASASNDFVTYTQLNANLNTTTANVAAVEARRAANNTTFSNEDTALQARIAANTLVAASNDFVTFTRLNANVNVVSANTVAVETRRTQNIAGAVSSVTVSDLTASRALASDGSGKIAVSDITATELGYLDGVSSAIQTQLDTKIATTASASNDFVTFTRLNANLNTTTANVTAVEARRVANIAGAISQVTTGNLTGSRALASDGFGKIAASDITSTELGYLDGVSSAIQTQLDTKIATTASASNDFVTFTRLNANLNTTTANVTAVEARRVANIAGAVSTVTTGNLTTSRALASDGSGKIAVSDITATELGYLDGVSSAIQTQLDTKIATTASASNDFVTFTRVNANVNVVSANTVAVEARRVANIAGAVSTVTTGNLTASRALASDGFGKIAVSAVTSTELGYLDGVSSAIQTQLDAKQATITGGATTIDTEDLTASRALVSSGSGKVAVSDVTSTELGYLDGVSSAIQTQLNAKAALAGATFTGEVTIGDDLVIDGNLSVHGSTVTANAVNIIIQDQFMALSNGGTSSMDVGIFYNRGTEGNAAVWYDASASSFYLSETRDPFSNTTVKPTSAANLNVGTITATSFTGSGAGLTAGTTPLTTLDIDGATDIGAALVDADLFIVDDGASGANRKSTMARIKTYINASASGSVAADDITAGDAAVLLTTSSGNITIDAAANDSDIILKGTDGGADTTFLTIDGSAAGKATFNNEIVSGAVITSGAGLIIADDGNIGSASDTDAIAISSGGVVTMNQIPVFSAGINVSGGTIAGTLATAAQTNITSLGTLTALTVDDVAINGKVITMTGSSSDTAVFTAGTNGTLSIVTTDAAAAAANIQITADGTFEVDATTITLDSVGDIVLDAAGADVILKDANTEYGRFTNSSSDFVVQVSTADKDILFKGSSGFSSLTALTLDMSSSGAATFNGAITGGGLLTTGGNIVIPNAGTIGSASDTDAIAISSGGVVTMNQIPVFSAGINVSGGTIAGTLATAAQTNITSLGTLTALTVDDINLNGKVLTITGDTDDTFKITSGTHGATTLATIDTAGTNGLLTLDADGRIHLDAADAGVVILYNNGTRYSSFDNSGSDFNINNLISDGDILFKGSDGGSGITALTLDMSAAGAATFNAGITSGAGLIIADAGTIGSASDTDAIAISSGGVVTMNQIPVFSAGINVSGGTIAGTLATAAQTNITSVGTLTTLTIDNIIINGTNIGHTSDTDAIAISSGGVVTMNQIPVFSAGINVSGGTIAGTLSTAAQTNITSVGALDGGSITSNFGTINTGSSDITTSGAVTGGTLAGTISTAAQGNITSLGTLTTLTVDNIIINGTNIGHTSDTDAIAIASDGVVTMNQIPVFSAGINVSGGTIAGTLATAAQTNITSLGTLTALTVDDVNINGKVITITGDTDDTFKITTGGSGATTLSTIDTAGINGRITLDADGYIELDSGGQYGQVFLDISGTNYGEFYSGGSNFNIRSNVDNADMKFHGKDGGSYINVLTFDMSENGKATFLDQIVSGAVITSGAGLVIANGGTIGSASDTDAIAISSGGVVTMNQIPVFSAGINVSGGTIAGTLATAAQANITSVGTLTTLTVDNIVINGTNIGHTSDTDAIAISSGGVVTMNQIPVFSAGINVSGGTIAGTLATAAQTNITSLGTLTALTVDDINLNGKVITITGDTSDTFTITTGAAGATTLATTDAAGTGGALILDADGTVTLDAGDTNGTTVFKRSGTTYAFVQESSNDAFFGSNISDGDLYLRGNDGGSYINALKLDMSAAGAATFNAGITSGAGLIIADAGTIGSASDTDAIAISSGGVVTMNQIPVFSAGINVSGGTIAGTLATAAQGNVTSLGTLTTLTVDSIIINGANIGHTSDTDAIAISSGGVVTMNQIPVFSAGINVSGGSITGSGAGLTAGTTPITTLNIGGGASMDAAVVDADLLILYDNGAINKKLAASTLKTYMADLTLTTAAQTNITSVGTLTALTVDDVNINGKVITITGDTSDTFTITAGAAGATTLATTDAAGAVGHLTLDADGEIILDAGDASGTTSFKNSGTTYAQMANSGTSSYLVNIQSDGNIFLRGNDGGAYINALELDMSDAGTAIFNHDIYLKTDSSHIDFGVNAEIRLAHVHDTGLLLTDSGGTPTLQLHDANESVSSDGSKLILTSNGVAFNMPTADGSSGQVLKTNGSRVLSFTDLPASDPDPATTLASDTDCGTAAAAADSLDAFGVAIDDAFVELDLKTQGANKLGTVDMGALS